MDIPSVLPSGNSDEAAVLALMGPAFARTTGAQIPVDGGSDRVV